jgi:hypothetical protein
MWSGRFGWNSEASDFGGMKQHIAPFVESLIDPEVRRRVGGKVEAIAFGVDLLPDVVTRATAELAVVYDLTRRVWHVTGKSFPRGDQRRVVRVTDLSSHFMKVAGERTLVLGCHDLNIFSPRGRSRQRPNGPLADVRRQMDQEVRRYAPTVALQLPHGTDTPRTWIPAWKALAARTNLRAWASGIAFYRVGGRPERRTFEEVCSQTWGGEPCMDLATQRMQRRVASTSPRRHSRRRIS